MSVCSIGFLIILSSVSATIFFIPSVAARQFTIATYAALFLYSQGVSAVGLLVLVAFLLSGYWCACVLGARPARGVFPGYLFALVLAFIWLKRYGFLRFVLPSWIFDHPVAIVGLSYMLFRQIHFIVDNMQGQIQKPALWTYLNYQLNPFTLLAGPIARFQDFGESWTKLGPILADRQAVLNAYLRVFCGMVKVVLISSAFQTWHEQLVSQIGEGGLALRLGRFVLVLNTYMMFLYFNFSGYCDAVIAGAALVGLPLPENFNYPFLSRNLLDYWSRWHITLGHWIRDYLFTPFYKAGVERFPNRTMTVAVVSYFFAFSLAGVWHGSTWNFLIYGLLHGAGVSAAKLWEHAIIKRSGRPGLRRYLARPGIRWLAIFLTYNYASFTLFFFAFDLERGIRILNDVLALPVRGY